MEKKPGDKTLGVRTGKDILNLFKSKEKKDSGLAIVKPRDEIESSLYTIWTGLLGHENFGIHEDFFQIGGNSLKGIQVVSRIAKTFHISLQPTDIFINTTIADLAAFVREKQKGASSFSDLVIPPRPELIPLSFGQERLWFIQQVEGSSQYNVPAVLRVVGTLDVDALNYTLQTIINRHESLRTVIIEHQGQPYQSIKEKDGLQIDVVDGSWYQADAKKLYHEIDKLINYPFDLSRDHMIRVTLIKLSESEHVIVFVVNHIASDAWSLSILVNEVMELYASHVEGREAALPTLNIQYADYSLWQRSYLTQENLETRLNYWKEKLQGVVPLELPTDYNRPAVASTRGAATTFIVDKKVSADIRRLSEQIGTSLFMVLLSAYKVLLHHYSGQTDISVGTSIATRPRQEFEGLIGFFVNTIALRTEVDAGSRFIDLLQQVKVTTVEAYEHQDVPFEKVVDAVMRERNPVRSPLFQVMMVLHNTPEIPKLRLGEIELSYEPFNQQVSKFDITFFITDTGAALQCTVEYNTDLYKEETIVRMTGHFQQLLSSITQSPEEKIGSLSLLTSKEKTDILSLSHAKVDYPKTKTIVSLFEEQVLRTPEAIAIVFEQQALTYRSLNERANQLAHYLRNRGIKEDTLVPLCIERSPAMMISMLGILKAGAAYVPIEPDFPEERKSFIIEDTNATVIVSSTESSSTLPGRENVQVIEVDDQFSGLTSQPTDNPQTALFPSHLAYVIYTSGSTGRPKGVMVGHQSLVDYVFGLNQAIGLEECKSFALVSSIATDLGNTVIYPSWIFGGVLHLFSKESVSDSEYVRTYFSDKQIDCLKIVPSHWKALSIGEEMVLPSKVMIFGGEALQSDLVQKIRSSDASCRIINHYGPTETTIGKLLHEVIAGREYNKTIPIGKPFSNTSVYVLSRQKQLCPLGVAGELHISGEGLARGYLNNDDLTAEKFITASIDTEESVFMYRTGDLVRLQADGNIEFIGRVDDQVKIRGYRVELGEIESIVLQSNLVQQAVVLAREDKEGNKNLVAYVSGTEDFYKDSVVSYLRERLPDYMVPTIWVNLERFPLLPNGKVDRKGLPEPDVSEELANQYQAPTNETESRLAAIWQDVLEVDQVGINDDFFELGGHSLLAVRLVSAIRKEFEVEMPIGDVFDFPTVKSLAAQVNQAWGVEARSSIKVVSPRPAQIPLSFSQERLWFIDQLEGSVQYHVPAVLRLRGTVNSEALSYALKNVVQRHEILRTVYDQIDGHAYQVVRTAEDWSVTWVDGHKFKNDPSAMAGYVQEIINQPFDLANDYMIRAHFIELDKDDQVLVVTLHHIASDAWSRSILMKEVVMIYDSVIHQSQAALKPLPIQYADFAIWQREYMNGLVLEKNLSYWKNKLSNLAPLQLPTDFQRPAVWTARGAVKNFLIGKSLSSQLVSLSQREGTTLFMTLVTAFKVFLRRYSNQNDICLATAVAGRQQQEVEGLIGFFINTLALRTVIPENVSFLNLLQQVKTVTLEGYEHQEIPFEKVVDAVVKERDLSRSPLTQVQFVLRNTPDLPDLRLGDASMSVQQYDLSAAKLDLSFYITETASGLEGSIEYATDLYREETIASMIMHFHNILESVVREPDQNIMLIPMLTEAEEKQLLVEFNNTKADYPKHKTLVDLFEEQVSRTPDKVAVEFENEQLTYDQLNAKVNQLAHYLQSVGIREGILVPVCIDRGLEMIVAILAILKTGAAYVPIDPEYPEERIAYVMQDVASSIVLTNKRTISRLPQATDLKVIQLDADRDWSAIDTYSFKNPDISIHSNHLAYVIFTSGSTGKPKGVMIEHHSVINLLLSIASHVGFDNKSSILSVTTFSFDICYLEFFMPLIYGGRLILVSRFVATDGFELAKKISDHQPTHMQGTPSTWQLLLNAGWENHENVKLLVGGEALREDLKDALTKMGDVWNVYGPTETTIWSTAKKLDAASKVSIGMPLANTEIYILSEKKQLNPIIVPGEILIGGAGLARGYFNRPELTAEKFVPNPFTDVYGSRLYKTGDLGRWMPDGNLEYLGRLDDQVKIRGYRIELGEVETILQQCDLVKQAAVAVKRDSSGNQRLVGYIVPQASFDRDAIVEYTRKKLPEYMVPGSFVALEQLPLTPNGKIDRKALPDIAIAGAKDNQYEAPRNGLENELNTIWKNVLGIDSISIHDNFFELGGDSILTVQVTSQLKKLGYDVHPKDMFIHQTIAKMATAIVQTSRADTQAEQGQLTGRSGLLPIQQWYLRSDQSEPSNFSQTAILGISKNITETDIRIAVSELLEMHDALRFKYSFVAGEWLQEYGSAQGVVIVEDFQSTPQNFQELLISCANRHQKSLDIFNGDLIRVVLIKTPGSQINNRLVIVIHHLAIDGVSWRILLDDLEFILTTKGNGRKAVPSQKSSSYRQWFEALVRYSETDRLVSQKSYWQQPVTHYYPLPVDTEYDGELTVGDMAQQTVMLDAEHTDLLLHGVPRVYNTVINDLLICGLSMTLSEWSRQDNITIGLEGHGRSDIGANIDISRTVGWFTSLFPIVVSKAPEGRSDIWIKSIKEQLRQIPDEGIGYGVLKYIVREPSLQRKDPWDLIFNYLGQFDNLALNNGFLSLTDESVAAARGTRQNIDEKLVVNCHIKGGRLIISWSYSTRHYVKDTISRLADGFLSNLVELISHCITINAAGATIHTPSDYGLGSEISYEDLDRFLQKRENNLDNSISF